MPAKPRTVLHERIEKGLGFLNNVVTAQDALDKKVDQKFQESHQALSRIEGNLEELKDAMNKRLDGAQRTLDNILKILEPKPQPPPEAPKAT